MNPFPIAGLKQSGPLALVRAPGATGLWLRSLLSSLKGERINLALLAWQQGPDAEAGLCFCVDEALGPQALALAAQNANTHSLPEPSLVTPATAVTAYPLGKNIRLPALMQASFNRSGIEPLAMATSLSAVVALLPRQELGPALEIMQTTFALPSGASPPEAGIKVVHADAAASGAKLAEPVSGETVAVYAERPISCYGLKAEDGLMMWQAQPSKKIWSKSAFSLADLEPPLRLGFMAAYWHSDDCRLSICLPQDQADGLAGALPIESATSQAACMINLQGPHFGDRPGIAAGALEGMAHEGIEPMAMSGVVHSLFIAVEPASAQGALRGLATRFSDPAR
jgi:hypothetical protein